MRRIWFELRLYASATFLEWALDAIPKDAKPDAAFAGYVRSIGGAAKALGAIVSEAKRARE